MPPIKKILRPIISLLGTDIGLSFEQLFISFSSVLKIEKDEPVLFNGMYRKIVTSKNS